MDVVTKMKYWKAAGLGEESVEMIMYGGMTVIRLLVRLCYYY